MYEDTREIRYVEGNCLGFIASFEYAPGERVSARLLTDMERGRAVQSLLTHSLNGIFFEPLKKSDWLPKVAQEFRDLGREFILLADSVERGEGGGGE